MKVLLLALILAANGVYLLHAQTSIDLRTQVKNVDFSNADWTRTSKTGTALPSLCQVGETFFKSDAAPGLNLYGCSATNIWSLQSGAPGAQGPTGATGPQGPAGGGSGSAVIITRTDAATLTVSLAGVTLKLNGIPVTFTQDSMLAVQPSQTGTARIFVSAGTGGTAAGTVTVANTMATPPVCTRCTVISGTGYPNPAIEIATWDAANGVWNASATTIPQDSRQALNLIAGSGVSLVQGTEGIKLNTFPAMLDTSIGSNFEMDEEFLSSPGYGNVGGLGWNAVLTSGADEGVAVAEIAHPGMLFLKVATTAGSDVALTLASGGTGKQTIIPGTGATFTTLEQQFWFKTDTVVDYAFGVGITNSDLAGSVGQGVGIVFNPGTTNCTSGGNTTQFSFMWKNAANGQRRCIASGLAVQPDTWYLATISSTGTSTVSYSIKPYGGPAVSGTAVVDFATTAGYSMFQVSQVTGQAGSRVLYVDKWHMKMTGLAR